MGGEKVSKRMNSDQILALTKEPKNTTFEIRNKYNNIISYNYF
jgi:hypothetical protein